MGPAIRPKGPCSTGCHLLPVGGYGAAAEEKRICYTAWSLQQLAERHEEHAVFAALDQGVFAAAWRWRALFDDHGGMYRFVSEAAQPD